MFSIILQTERLLLRPPVAADISKFVPLIGDLDVARNLSRVPHPYTEDDGCAFVVKAAHERRAGTDYAFAVLSKSDGAFIGICGIHLPLDFMLGYWIGKPYWGRGFATEAARRVARFTFDELGAERLAAGWFDDNPASGRVLRKLGFQDAGSEEKDCLSRTTPVICHKVTLTRADFDAPDSTR